MFIRTYYGKEKSLIQKWISNKLIFNSIQEKKSLFNINSWPWRMSKESVRSQDIRNYLFKPVYDMLWTFCQLWFSSDLGTEIMNCVLQRYWKTVMENIKNEQYWLSCMVTTPLLTEILNCAQYLNTLCRQLSACIFGLYFHYELDIHIFRFVVINRFIIIDSRSQNHWPLTENFALAIGLANTV